MPNTYTDSGRKKPTYKTDKEMRQKLKDKGYKVKAGPIYKPKGITGDDNKGPGYYVQYESHPGKWGFLGKNHDAAMKTIG